MSEKNFKICCTTEEVTNMMQYLTLDTMREVKKIFDDILTYYDCDDWIWKKYTAVSSIYIMGYVSGCRTTRKKHKGVVQNG